MKSPFIIAAVADNLAIGRHGEIPWHLRADLIRFKKLTTGHAVVMGRRTFESIGRALPNRLNIVVSKSLRDVPEGVVICRSLDEALSYGDARSDLPCAVIGGAALYKEALPLADTLELTRVKVSPQDADTFFPEWHYGAYALVRAENELTENGIAFSFETWKRS